MSIDITDTLYSDLVVISALCVRRIYPDCRITILTDDESLGHFDRAFGGALQYLAHIRPRIRSVGRFDGSARHRSRFVKTQARSVLRGDFLYMDADAIPVSKFDEIFKCQAPLSAALDRNRRYPLGGFPASVVPDFQRMSWSHPTKFYLNGGVVFWKDCRNARALGQMWHQNWLRYVRTVDNPADQPAFNHSISQLNIEPKILDDTFNARVGVPSSLPSSASIYHFYITERPKGTFIDRLLRVYRACGWIDLSLIDDAARLGHPWR